MFASRQDLKYNIFIEIFISYLLRSKFAYTGNALNVNEILHCDLGINCCRKYIFIIIFLTLFILNLTL